METETNTTTHGPVTGQGTPTCACGQTFKTWRGQGIHETAANR